MLSRRLLRIKVVKALFAHLKSGADNMIASEKTLMTSVDKAYDLYFQILILPVEIARYAEQRQELAKQKKLPTHEDLNPNTKFVDNQIIRVIANSDAVNDYAAARKLNWTRYPELIRTLYTQLTESDYFKDYMARPERSFADDRKLLEDFFKELQSCEPLDNVLEEMSILWSDDLPYIVMMILRSLSNLRPTHTEGTTTLRSWAFRRPSGSTGPMPTASSSTRTGGAMACSASCWKTRCRCFGPASWALGPPSAPATPTV